MIYFKFPQEVMKHWRMLYKYAENSQHVGEMNKEHRRHPKTWQNFLPCEWFQVEKLKGKYSENELENVLRIMDPNVNKHTLERLNVSEARKNFGNMDSTWQK